MKPEASKVGFKCKGCELASDGLFDIGECVHDKDCMFYDPGWPRVSVPCAELKLLCEIALAAERFDRSGSTVKQMNREQWEAYTDLKALFHGGIEFRA